MATIGKHSTRFKPPFVGVLRRGIIGVQQGTKGCNWVKFGWTRRRGSPPLRCRMAMLTSTIQSRHGHLAATNNSAFRRPESAKPLQFARTPYACREATILLRGFGPAKIETRRKITVPPSGTVAAGSSRYFTPRMIGVLLAS